MASDGHRADGLAGVAVTDAQSRGEDKVSLAFGGDVLLGVDVNSYVAATAVERRRRAGAPAADVAIMNLESVVATSADLVGFGTSATPTSSRGSPRCSGCSRRPST